MTQRLRISQTREPDLCERDELFLDRDVVKGQDSLGVEFREGCCSLLDLR